MLGLGLGLSKGTNLLSNLKLLTRNSDWAIWGDKASGQAFPVLAERTLPNGVKNGIRTKNVSDDLIAGIDFTFITIVTGYQNLDYAVATFIDNSNFLPSIDGKCAISNKTEIASTDLNTNISLNAFYTNERELWLPVPLGTTLAQAQTLLAGTVIRYQLAVPIDTLNSPQVNPIQDLVGTADGTLQGFAFTSASGYVDVPIKGVGDEISYSNLVTNPTPSSVSGYNAIGATSISYASEEITIGIIAQFGGVRRIDFSLESGGRYYVSAEVLATSNSIVLKVEGNSIPVVAKAHSGSGGYEKLGIIINPTVTASNYFLNVQETLAGKSTTCKAKKFLSHRLDNNPQVIALESKLGRQLTAAECDYLFDFTATTNTIKAKVVTGIQGDGANDVILLPSNAPNPVGLQDFGFAFVFKTGATLGVFRSIMSRVGIDSTATQYDFIVGSDGRLYTLFENITTSTSTVITTATFYKLVMKRKSNRLYITINGVPLVDVAFSTSLTTKPNARLMARASNIEGTTHTAFSNALLLYADYNNGDNIDAWEADQNKAIKSIYGL